MYRSQICIFYKVGEKLVHGDPNNFISWIRPARNQKLYMRRTCGDHPGGSLVEVMKLPAMVLQYVSFNISPP